MPVHSRLTSSRHIIVPLRDAPTSKYSPERRALCHVDADKRFPDFPDVCPACQGRTTRLWLQICYDDPIAGLWSMACDNKKCRHVHIPEQVGPTGMHAAQITALVHEEAASAATQLQIHEDAKLARELEAAQRTTARNSKRAGKILNTVYREETKKATVKARVRKQDAAAHSAAKALRAKLASGDVGVTRRRAPKQKAPLPDVERQGAMLVWTKDSEPPTEHDIVIPANGKFNIAKHAALLGLYFKFWVADEAAWVWELNSPVQVPRDHTTVLVRMDGVRAPQGFADQLHLMENYRGDTEAARARNLKAAQSHLIDVNAREWDVGHVWVTFWWKDYVEPRVWNMAYSRPTVINLSDHDEVINLWKQTGLPAQVDVWMQARGDWKTYDIRDDIPVPGTQFLMLIRFPDIDGLVNFPVELYALEHPHAARLPFASMPRASRALSSAKCLARAGTGSSSDSVNSAVKNKTKMSGKSQRGAPAGPSRHEGDLSEVGVAVASAVGGPAAMDLDDWMF